MGEQFKRKKFFINKRLQIRYMISMLIPMLILIVFIGLVMYYSQYKFLYATTREMGKDLKDIIRNNQMYVPDDAQRNEKTVNEIKIRLGQYISGEKNFSKSLLQTAYKILFVGIFVVIIEIAFLTIFISHKVAGPIYRFVMFAKDIRSGNFSTRIYLRKGDELTDVAMDFNKTGEFLCETFKKLADITQQTLEAGKGGHEKEKIAMLEKEFKEIQGKIKTV